MQIDQTTQNDILNRIENVELMLSSMTVHAIHNTARGEYLLTRLNNLKKLLENED